MLLNNGLPQLITDTGITGLIIIVLYKIIVKLLEKIPQCP